MTKSFICFPLLGIIILLRSAIGEEIQCKSSCYKVREIIKLEDGRYLTCHTRAAIDPPRPRRHDATASSIQNPALSWYLSDGEDERIALNITWSMRKYNIPDHKHRRYFQGFYLTVGWKDFGLPYIVSVKISKKKPTLGDRLLLIKQNNSSKDLFFSYKCYGTKNQVIRPNDQLKVTYEAIPLAQINNTRYTKFQQIKIPDCTSEEAVRFLKIPLIDIIPNTCRKSLQDIQARLKENLLANESDKQNITEVELYINVTSQHLQAEEIYVWHMKVTHALLIVLLIVLLLAIFTRIITRRKKGQQAKTEVTEVSLSILIIADSSNETNLELTRRITHRLRKEQKFKVTCNYEARIQIPNDPLSWYTTQIDLCDVVIFSAIYDEFDFDNFIRKENCDIKGGTSNELKNVKNYIFTNWKHAQKDCIILVSDCTEKSPPKCRKRLKICSYADTTTKHDKFIKILQKCKCKKQKKKNKSRMKKIAAVADTVVSYKNKLDVPENTSLMRDSGIHDMEPVVGIHGCKNQEERQKQSPARCNKTGARPKQNNYSTQ